MEVDTAGEDVRTRQTLEAQLGSVGTAADRFYARWNSALLHRSEHDVDDVHVRINLLLHVIVLVVDNRLYGSVAILLVHLVHAVLDEILAVFKTVVYTDSPEAFKYYRFTDAQSPEEFEVYIDKCKELSLYDTGVSAEYGDKLITLSTCEYSRTNGRIVVVAKKVTESSGANAPANDGAAEIPS